MKTRSLIRTIPLALLAMALATGLLALACAADTPVATAPTEDAAESPTSELAESLATGAETRRAPVGMRVRPELLDVERVSARLAAACTALPQGDGRPASASMRVRLDAAGSAVAWSEAHPSDSEVLDQALVEWFGDLRFSPMFEDGRPVPVRRDDAGRAGDAARPSGRAQSPGGRRHDRPGAVPGALRLNGHGGRAAGGWWSGRGVKQPAGGAAGGWSSRGVEQPG